MPTLLVFGARNLGRVLATDFAADGWRVAGVARSEDTIRVLVDDVPNAVGVIADASKPNDLERVFRDVGDVELIVNAITTTPGFGGPLHEAPPDALEPYIGELLPATFNVLRMSGRVLAERGRGTLIQVTGGSARRGNPGRGPWAAAAFATRALVQAQAAELRERNVHAALLIVDAVIESDKTAAWLEDEPPEKSASMEEVSKAVKYLHEQSPRGWTHELQLTPSLERWVP
ncbi:MAG TPA: SDR family NAD(P)-dependent oxidoreductase [Gaiellaceae bacterium]